MTASGTVRADPFMGADARSRLRIRDAVAVAFSSLFTRRLRAALTAAGIAIGIAVLVAVLGVTASSRADVLAQLDELGTGLLTVRPGESFVGAETALPDSAPGAVRRMDGVENAAATGILEDATARRTDLVPATQTSGIRVAATEASLLQTLQVRSAIGRFFDTVSDEHPVVVLGDSAARRLGIGELADQPLVWIGEHWFAVVGVLDPVPLAPELDSMALVGWSAAAELVLGVEPRSVVPTTVYVRTLPDALDGVRGLLPRTANPASPEAVQVSRPSDALAARAAVDTSFTALLLGLGGVALLVGGIGIANVMVVAVLERRNEIGLRRALGATRRHIRIQFLVEAVVLAGAGGVLGVGLGVVVSAGFTANRGWPFAPPLEGLVAAVALAILVGGLAGLYPARRAARLQPAQAVRPA